MARHETAKPEARLTTKPCGQLGLWIYIDGKLMDIIHYSDLQHVVNNKTFDAITRIYDEYKLEEEE